MGQIFVVFSEYLNFKSGEYLRAGYFCISTWFVDKKIKKLSSQFFNDLKVYIGTPF